MITCKFNGVATTKGAPPPCHFVAAAQSVTWLNRTLNGVIILCCRYPEDVLPQRHCLQIVFFKVLVTLEFVSLVQKTSERIVLPVLAAMITVMSETEM
jgi:hypothetical protein